MEAKIIQIGNSKGVRLPKSLILKYHFGDHVVIKELEQGLLILSTEQAKLSWEETYKAMAAEQEDWSDWTELDVGDVE